MGRINVCISCDDNYAQYAGVVAASVLANAEKDSNICFYILDGGISEANKEKILSLKSIKSCEINFVTIDEKLFEDYKQIKTHAYLSIAAYYRLKISTLLPDTDKIIYLDCDVVVNKDLRELFDTELKEYIVAGVKDINFRMLRKNPSYVNSGMLLMDLKKIREQNIEKEFLEYTRANIDTIKLGDQEIINTVLNGKIKLLPDRWNVQSSNFTNRSIYTNNPWIIHYVGKQKPWKFGNWNYYNEYYYRYLQLTPWAIENEKDYLAKSKKAGIIGYIKYRPLFMLRPRFYKALFKTYICKE